MANTYTTELQLVKPTPADPLSQNSWGTLLNTTFDLVDSATAGQLSLSVTGSTNVTLTSVQGGADQERNQHFVFSGAITSNILVLYPSARTKQFSVLNSTTGTNTLGVGVSNGSGGALGTTVQVPQNVVIGVLSDGTNVATRTTFPVGTAAGDLIGTYPSPGVAKIQGATISSAAPTDSQVLTYVAAATQWQPQPLGAIGGLPSGAIVDFAGTTVPVGFLECNGQAVLRTTFSALFGAIGVGWGAGDGTTTFNVPNFNGFVTLGRNGAIIPAVGTSGGANSFTLAQTHIPNYNLAVSDPTHAHEYLGFTEGGGGAAIFTPNPTGNSFNFFTQPAATGISVNSAGGGAAFSLVQPSAAVIKMIKT